MDKATIDKLENLPTLFEGIKDVMFSHDKDRWAKHGLITVAELDVLYQAEEARQSIYEAGEAAEAAVPKPDYRAHWPQEARDLAVAHDEAQRYYNQQRVLNGILHTLEGNNPYGSESMMETLRPLRTAAEVLRREIIKREDAQNEDIYTLEGRLHRAYDAKMRRGGKVVQINHDLTFEHDCQKRAAREAVTVPLQREYAAIFEKAETIKSAVDARKQKLAWPIVAQIKRLLHDAAQ